jgi:hypothetical protein
MDMSGRMPRRAFVEVRREDGSLLDQIQAEVDEDDGSISAPLPAFAEGERGTVVLFTEGEEIWEDEVGELPAAPTVLTWQIG